MPIARSTIFIGRSLADTARNLVVVALMTGLGAALGFRFHAAPIEALLAVGLVLALGLAFSWLSALIGLSVRTPETVQVSTLLMVIPLSFTSSMFVPIATMPGWLRLFARFNPVTRCVDAVRGLTLNTGTAVAPAVLWIGVLLIAAIPATLARNGRSAS